LKVTQIVVDYQITRSQSYQSVRLGASATVELAEGDDKKVAIEKTTRWLAACLNSQAEDALQAVLTESRLVEGI
jgi:hypothetical protein